MATIEEQWRRLGLDPSKYYFGDKWFMGLEYHIHKLFDFNPNGKSHLSWVAWGFTPEGGDWAEREYSKIIEYFPNIERYEAAEIIVLNRCREMFPFKR